MSRRVTMRDVAQAAGVSPMTVSRALSPDGSVNAQTRAQVREAAERLGYVYDTTAQAFRAQRSGFVGVTLPSINNANFAATHKALTETLAETDLQMLLGITNYNLSEEERLVERLLARRPDAMVLTGGHHTDRTRRLLSALDIPVIEIWDLPPDPIGHVVGFSNAAASALLVDHLVATGRRRFGYLGASGPNDRRGDERREGVIAAARRLGLPEVVVLEAAPAPLRMTDAARAVSAALPHLRDLDALLCVADPVAFAAITTLTRAGLKVPEDLAVTGFGAFEIARIAHPTLTTVEVGAEEIGHKTGALVRAALAPDQAPPRAQQIRTTPRLVLGQSA